MNIFAHITPLVLVLASQEAMALVLISHGSNSIIIGTTAFLEPS